MRTLSAALLALALASSAAHAQYTAYPYGQNSTILMPQNNGMTGGFSNGAPQSGPAFLIPNARLQPVQPSIVTPQNWQQFQPGYR
jgi:hypothetical protein